MTTAIVDLITPVRYKIHDLDALDYTWSSAEITGYIKEAVKKMAQYKYKNTDKVTYTIVSETVSPTLKVGDESLTTDITKVLMLAHTGVNFGTEEISVNDKITPRDDEEFIKYLIDLASGQKFGYVGYFDTDDNYEIELDFGT